MLKIKTFPDWEAEFHQEGRQEGLQEGLQKGRQIGLQKGAMEKARESAQLMIDDGKSEHEIHRYTGLSIEQIRQMKLSR